MMMCVMLQSVHSYLSPTRSILHRLSILRLSLRRPCLHMLKGAIDRTRDGSPKNLRYDT